MSRGAVRHVAYFRATTHRGLETFQLLVRSEDMGLAGLLRHSLLTPNTPEILDAAPVVEDVCQIIIHDCRRNRPMMDDNLFTERKARQANIALIEQERLSRDTAFAGGFADVVSWPILAAELYARVLGQCRSLSLSDTNFRYSPVVLVERCCVQSDPKSGAGCFSR